MGQIVYADLLFLVNFTMDFLCFFVTARILCRPFKVWRCCIASVLGGVYSVVVLFAGFNAVIGLLADLGFCIIMCLVAYGIKENQTGTFLFHATVYFGVSVGTGGCMTAMYSLLNRMDLPLDKVESNPDGISVWLFGLLAVASGVIAAFGGKIFKNVSNDAIVSVYISYNKREATLNGIIDTGNMLKDPISGKPVMIINSSYLSKLISDECIEFALRGDILNIMRESPEHRVRLVPIHTAAGSAMICAFVPDKATITTSGIKGKYSGSCVELDILFAPSQLCLTTERKAMECAVLLPAGIIN